MVLIERKSDKMKDITIYAVLKAYNKDGSIRYDVLPYSLKGTFICYFSKGTHRGNGRGYNLINRIEQFAWFIKQCRLSVQLANKLANELTYKGGI